MVPQVEHKTKTKFKHFYVLMYRSLMNEDFISICYIIENRIEQYKVYRDIILNILIINAALIELLKKYISHR